MIHAIVDTAELQKAVRLVSDVPGNFGSMPVLANLLLEASGGKLSVTATDLEIVFKATVPAETHTEGTVTVPAKLFRDISSSLNGEVTISESEDHTVDISSGRFASSILGLSPDDFPRTEVEFPERLDHLPGPQLGDAIEKALLTVSANTASFNFSGIHMDVRPGAATISSSDSYRLTRVSFDAPGCSTGFAALISKKGAGELKAMCERTGEIGVCCDSSSLAAAAHGRIIRTRLLEGRFPDCTALVPSGGTPVALPRAETAAALKRLSHLTGPKSRTLKLDAAPGTFGVSVDNPELGKASEELDIGYSGPSFSVMLSSDHLAGAMKALKRSEEFILWYTDEKTPLKVTSNLEPGFVLVISTVTPRDGGGFRS